MSGNKYQLKDFKNMAQALEAEYKNHQDVTKLNKKLMTMCANRGISTAECQNMSPEFMHILNQIWNVKHGSKQSVINTIAKNVDTKKPLHLSSDDKKGMHIVNDMNFQHDVYTAKNKNVPTQSYGKAKPLVSEINKNYNDYHEVWNKLKAIETRYIRDYRAYYAIKNKTNYNEADKKKLSEMYNDITKNIIPEFKKLNKTLDQLIDQRNVLATKFYNIYETIPVDQRGSVTMPTTAFDVHKKAYTTGSAKPKVNVTKCVQKTWGDAVKAGFNPTFYAPCHIARQTELIKNCSSKFDWPFIAYSPNMYQPWDPSQKMADWMKTCLEIEQHERPYIGV